MASRDGFVDYPLSIPSELRYLIERYQNDMKITSFNQAIRTLLETHPEIDKRVRDIYTGTITPETEDPG